MYYWNYSAGDYQLLRNFTSDNLGAGFQVGTATYSDTIPSDGINNSFIKTKLLIDGGSGLCSVVRYYEGKAVIPQEYQPNSEFLLDTMQSYQTSAGENWTFSCMASDGTENTSWSNSTAVAVREPPFTLSGISPATAYTNNSLSINATFANSTNQSEVILNFEWDDGANVKAARFISDGLIAYYPFDGNYYDYAGSYDGTAVNATLNASYGKFGSGAGFDGDTSYVQIGNGTEFTDLCVNGCSFSFWAKFENSSETKRIIARSNRVNDDKFLIITLGSGTVQFYLNGDGNSSAYAENVCSLSADYDSPQEDTWYHVTTEYNTTDSRIFLDGELIGNMTCSNLTINQTLWQDDEPVYIGKDGDSVSPLNWNGAIDEVMIFNRSLNESEISVLYEGSRYAESDAGYSKIDSGLTTKLETWTATVTMHNMTSVTDASTSESRTIQNSLPATVSASIYPTSVPAGADVKGLLPGDRH